MDSRRWTRCLLRLRLSSFACFASRAFSFSGRRRLYGTVFSFFITFLIKTFPMHQVNTNAVPNSLDAEPIPNGYASQPMVDKEQPRSIRFSQRLWDAIDRDAVRCGRSSVKQMEVLLSVYYGLRDVELDMEKLNRMGGVPVAPRSSRGIPLMNPKTTERRKVENASQTSKKNKRVA